MKTNIFDFIVQIGSLFQNHILYEEYLQGDIKI